MKYRIPEVSLVLRVKEPKDYKPFVISTPLDAEQFLTDLKTSPNEKFVALHLSARHEVIGINYVSEGTISGSLVHPREVFKGVILNNAHSVIVAHNHPAGSRLASQEDIATTRQLVAAGLLLGIPVLDHLIITPTKDAYSIRQNHSDLWR